MKTRIFCLVVSLCAGYGTIAPHVFAQTLATVAKTSATAAKAVDNPLKLADDAPTTYTVVKGDTLWGISTKFLKEPWRWAEIWNMNRDQVKDPHRIYPGNVITLSFDASGKPMLAVSDQSKTGASGTTVRLSPTIRGETLGAAIPSIPASVIGPFLVMPMVVEAGSMTNLPKIAATEDERVVVGTGDRVYAVGISPAQGIKWKVFRPGAALRDPVSNEILGHEVIYLGEARVNRFGDATTLTALDIVKAKVEMTRGDRLVPSTEISLPAYAPRAPTAKVAGRVVSVQGGVTETGQYSVVAINLGKREGMEIGHVLASSRAGKLVSTATHSSGAADEGSGSLWPTTLGGGGSGGSSAVPSSMKVPDERNGLLFVFNVFDRVSYALVMATKYPVRVGDVIATPQ